MENPEEVNPQKIPSSEGAEQEYIIRLKGTTNS